LVEYLDVTFAALSDATRRDILSRLTSGDASVSEIAEPYEMSLNAVSKHLMVLEGAGLIRRSVEGRTHRISLDAERLRTAAEWLEMYRGFWEQRLDALEEFLRAKKKKEKGTRHGS
jgi:DNA-binding transcriptional ArsR family regulator